MGPNMVRLILRALIGAFALYIAARLVHGIHYDTVTTLLIAAAGLGIVNAIIRPFLILLTLPITVLTLGLWLLLVNAAMLGLIAYLLPGLTVGGLIPALLGSIMISIVSWIGHVILDQGGAAPERD